MNWKELQQMAKEFDREARKERQGAGEHRADAVGLLTPALLRKHIKSGTDLVLAYGRKGATVSYTVDDLKRFVEARERADKAFRPEPRGVPLAQLENASREADRQRSQEVKSALLYKVSGNMLFFQVQGNINPHYLVRVRLEDWERHLHNPYLNPLIAAKEPAGYHLTAHVGATSTGIATSRRSVASPSIPQKNRTSQKSVTPA